MIWVKTEAGKAELKSHALIQQAATQNVLRAIDGVKPEELLLKYLPGVTREDFQLLSRLQLIEPARVAVALPTIQPRDTGPDATPGVMVDPAMSVRTRRLAMVLSRMVSSHLGLAGMALTSSIGRATTVEELRDIAQHVLGEVKLRKGDAVAGEVLNELRGLL